MLNNGGTRISFWPRFTFSHIHNVILASQKMSELPKWKHSSVTIGPPRWAKLHSPMSSYHQKLKLWGFHSIFSISFHPSIHYKVHQSSRAFPVGLQQLGQLQCCCLPIHHWSHVVVLIIVVGGRTLDQAIRRPGHRCWQLWSHGGHCPMVSWWWKMLPKNHVVFFINHQVPLKMTKSPKPKSPSLPYFLYWMFPKIVVPPNHPILIGFSIINHPFWGAPILGNTHITLI